jgi:hypothetical protein
MKYEIEEFMQTLMAFEANVVEDDFNSMFGRIKGPDLWIDFKSKCTRNTTIFYRILDEAERNKFHEYLQKNAWVNK